jgi:hypothetical protein
MEDQRENSKFEIAFTDESFTEEGVNFRYLRLKLGEFQEDMIADLTTWSPADYEAQWLNELTEIVGSRSRGALIVRMHAPAQPFRIDTWPMWREGGTVFFQNKILFMLKPAKNFDPTRVRVHIGKRQPHLKDGDPSEWAVPVAAVETFVSGRRKAHLNSAGASSFPKSN